MNWVNVLRYGGLALFLLGLALGAYQARRNGRALPAGWKSATAAVVLMFTSGWIENYLVALGWSVAALLLLAHGAWQYFRSAPRSSSTG